MISILNNCRIKSSRNWKQCRNNIKVALNIIYKPSNTKKINLAYKSEYNRKRKNQVVL